MIHLEASDDTKIYILLYSLPSVSKFGRGQIDLGDVVFGWTWPDACYLMNKNVR
jgi:hypothetical protein